MKKTLYTFLALFLVAAISVSAQDIAQQGKGDVQGPSVRQNLLWDNTQINVGTTGLISIELGGFGPSPAGQTNCAGDFTVPAGYSWLIEKLYAEGFSNPPQDTPPDYFGVEFYYDAGGSPGASFFQDYVIPDGGMVLDLLNLTLTTPLMLPEGTYWVSIYAFYANSTTLDYTRWNWYSGDQQIDAEAFLQDVPALFGGFPWTAFSGLGLTVTDVMFAIYGQESVIPVELTAFAANVVDGNVVLNWTTATETNNLGFEIEKKVDADWQKIGFVDGFGTTAETHNYTFVDEGAVGTVQYRLKQIDFEGSFEYSDAIEVNVGEVYTFDLSQNYPNPFNPSTVISYSIPDAQFVTLKVYDILGNEIQTLVNSNQEGGAYQVNFNADNLASGIYVYKMTAGDFSSIKKMMLVR